VTETSGERDLQLMRRALELARLGLGTTAPNPSVGAVVADGATGRIIAEGRTQPGGRPHAETEALGKAGAGARGATLYVTLEPCAHVGRTPPCADAVIAAGIGRLVAALADPDMRVSGRGFKRMRAAGIAVEVGLEAEAARWVALGHILRVTRNRPFIQVKVAVDANGLVPLGRAGQPLWVTGEKARERAHLLRAEADAIMVGSGTAAADDPELTCRLPGLEHRSPVRVVIGSRLRLQPSSKLARTAGRVPVWLIIDASRAAQEPAPALPAAVEVIAVDTDPGGWGRVDLRHAMRALAQRGITRVLVEGGPTLIGALYDADLIDELIVMRAPVTIGTDRGQPPIGGRGLGLLANPDRWQRQGEARLGPDIMLSFRRRSE